MVFTSTYVELRAAFACGSMVLFSLLLALFLSPVGRKKQGQQSGSSESPIAALNTH
jgi:hypothetical protein